MRLSASSKSGKSVFRFVAVFLLAGTAAGCSSDTSRFTGIFSRATDDITTNSVPRTARDVSGPLPTPRENVLQARQADDDTNVSPITGDITHDPIRTDTNGISGVRASVTPMRVEKVSLDAPSMSAPTLSTPKVTARKVGIVEAEVDAPVLKVSAWHVVANSPRIVVKSGETLSLISSRYSVPSKELMRANGLASADQVRSGQTIIIPVFGKDAPVARIKSETLNVADSSKKKLPVPTKNGDVVAVLPGSTREKSKVVADLKIASNGEADAAKDGVYVVKSGDSLARIAKAHKISVDALKAANGLETAQLRIGQKLRLSGNAPMVTAKVELSKTDATTTGAIPATKKVIETAANKPSTYKAPVDTKSVDEVEKTADVNDSAPDSTGIGKYRWPVHGQVTAGYGANVEGKRNTGIDISVPEGTAIKAAENGVVIYSGAGLKELGNTVLIRHDDGTVTVYGNASELKVTRGQKVQRGQTIAASGMSGGAKQPKLHFEVRKASSPVNPITFLE